MSFEGIILDRDLLAADDIRQVSAYWVAAWRIDAPTYTYIKESKGGEA